jgi:hypothetical protein
MSFALDLCLHSLVEAYGYPQITRGDAYLYLYYSDGLGFWYDIEEQRVVAVFLYPLEYFFDELFFQLDRSNADEFSHIFSKDCADNLNS